MKIFYAVSTHWDREWYKPFQGFRYDLVKMTDKLLEALENSEIDVFTFDGQTVVLEDYLDIKPQNKERIIQYIKSGKLKVGPWYIMPDELLVSGESLIKNFIFGNKISKEFGGSPWKLGYMNDIFGHIAQMPQLLSDMGIKSAYLGRGMGKKSQNYTNFVWEAPDGSKCFGYKDTYGAFRREFIENSCTKESVSDYLNKKTDKTGLLILLYTGDHIDIDENTIKFESLKNELAKEYDIIEGPEHLPEFVSDFEDRLPHEKGELITTAEENGFRAVTHSISSYYPIKRENDICEDLLENKISPMLSSAMIKGLDFESGFYNLSYKYLLKNQPHDSICGCSADVVHEDMNYRYSQIHSISNALLDDYYCRICKEYDRRKSFTIEIQNYEPKTIEGVFVTDIYFDTNWSNKVLDNAFYQKINGFDILDENGNSLPYQILNIKNGYRNARKTYASPLDKYTVAIKSNLKPFGGTVFKVTEGKRPYFVKNLSDGELVAENEFIYLQIENNGSVALTDKINGKTYNNLNTFIDDGEIGNGWFSERPVVFNNIVSSKGDDAVIEIIQNGPLVKTFRITKQLNIPKNTDYNTYSRCDERIDLKIVTNVTLKANSKSVEFEITVYNNAYDHRLRVEFPTNIEGENYHASQAFTFVERGRGVTEDGAAFYEPEPYEKNTSGIALVKKGNLGLSFIGKEGFHEVGVSKSGVITATMMRSFGRIMFGNIENKKAQLIGEHNFRYALSTETNFTALTQLKKELFNLYDNVCVENDSKSNSLFNVVGNVAVSIIKPSEDGKGLIVRLYNPTDEEEYAEICCGFNIKNTKLVNILEEEIDELPTTNNVIKILVGAQKFITIYTEIQ